MSGGAGNRWNLMFFGVLLLFLFNVYYFVLHAQFSHSWEAAQSNSEIGMSGSSHQEQLKILHSTLLTLRDELHHIKSTISVGDSVPEEHNGPSVLNLNVHNAVPEEHNSLNIEDKSASSGNIAGHQTGANGNKNRKKAILFTMDSISSYESSSLVGGAAGELIVRRSLEFALHHFGVEVEVMRSDAAFNAKNLNSYDFIILDPWTWAAKGWVPKANLIGQDDKIYILDFFGSKTLRKSNNPALRNHALNVPSSRFLTAFGSPDNTFLGYFVSNQSSVAGKPKLNQGVIWGKDPKHFKGMENILSRLADDAKLVSTSTSRIFSHDNVVWKGHLSATEWIQLLSESKFLIGLGNPISGPSAIDAISVGTVYINPIFEHSVQVNDLEYSSQHPYAQTNIGKPYVCNYHQRNIAELKTCVSEALRGNPPLQPFIPTDFLLQNYLIRVKTIFKL